MKKLLIIFTLSISFIFSACTVLKTNTAKTMDIYGAGVIQNPVVVDLDVKQTKVSGTAMSTAGKAVSIENIKNEAVSNALKTAKADVLVEPIFETTTTNGHTSVTVTGFPATYINFRNVKAEDVPLLQVGIIQKANVYEPPANQRKPTKGIFNK